jgi:hypothetical protein
MRVLVVEPQDSTVASTVASCRKDRMRYAFQDLKEGFVMAELLSSRHVSTSTINFKVTLVSHE